MENKVEWNKTSKKIAPFKAPVFYELVGLKINPMRKDEKVLELPFMSGVPSKDRIVEMDKEEVNVVDIAFIESFQAGGVPKFGTIIFYKASGGVMMLNPTRAKDVKLYDYMERCNHNQSNPDRDQKVPAIFRRIDKSQELKDKRAERQFLKDALIAVDDLSQTELTRLAIGLNITGSDVDDIRIKIEDFAEAKPKELLAMLENKDTEIMRRAEDAKKAKIISIDTQARHIKSASEGTLYSWPPQKNADWRKEFVKFVKSEDGAAFYKEMCAQLDAKK